MHHEPAHILTLGHAGEEQVWGGLSNAPTERFATVGRLLGESWSHVYIGGDCRLANPHVFAVVAEWGQATGADMIVFSAPGKLLLTRLTTMPGQCFQMIGEMGRLGILGILGNKFFSRALLRKLPPETSLSSFMLESLLRLDSLLTFSYPWAEPTAAGADMSDEDFLRLATRYAQRGGAL